MSEQFETVVTVAKHANYGSFQGTDKKFYKAAGDGMTLDTFVIGKTYQVKGYKSESGKTNYVTLITSDSPALDKAPVGRRIAPPKEEKAGDDKILHGGRSKATSSGTRDFVKEAKGKTFSLIVAGLAHNVNTVDDTASAERILALADSLLKGIEDREYF